MHRSSLHQRDDIIAVDAKSRRFSLRARSGLSNNVFGDDRPINFKCVAYRLVGPRSNDCGHGLIHHLPPPLLPRYPPPPDPRSVFGRASLTVSARPLSSLPLSISIARCPSASTFISTKANPLCCPVSRSVAILTRPTVPNSSNMAPTPPSHG